MSSAATEDAARGPAAPTAGESGYESLSMLLQAGVLERRMAEACALRPSTRAITGVACSGGAAWAEFRGPQCRDRTARDVVNLGCISKLITGTLAREVLGGADAADPALVAKLLGLGGSAGVTLRHLIDHTHGFDTSEITVCPRVPGGRVDRESLRDRLLCAPRLGRPGRLHSYSNASAWVVAAAVEEYCQTDLARLVCDRLFFGEDGQNGVPWLTRRSDPEAPFCAATGQGVEFSPAALLLFLSSFWRGDRRELLLNGQDEGGGGAVPLPGWSGAEQGIFWGWKTYASGWFGHNSSHPGAYGLVRVQPDERIALFAFSNDLSCNAIAAGLFGRVSPSLAPARIPRLLSAAEGLEVASYTGVYEVATMAVFIELSDEGRLRLRAHGKSRGVVSERPFFEAALRPATDRFFYTEPRHADLFPYVQVVRPLGDGDWYLWNGRFLWRRWGERG